MLHIRRLQNSIRRSPQSFLSGLLVVVVLASAGFIPASQTMRRTLGGRPFPCQIHACGCSDSSACGEHCCCFSPAELATWYREHAAELATYDASHDPPSASQQAYERRIALASDEETVKVQQPEYSPGVDATEKTVSAARRPRACCAAHASPCEGESRGDKMESRADETVTSDESFEFVQVSLRAQKRCQGISDSWLVLSQALPADATPLWQFDTAVAAFADSYDVTCPCVVSRPAVPPPRA